MSPSVDLEWRLMECTWCRRWSWMSTVCSNWSERHDWLPWSSHFLTFWCVSEQLKSFLLRVTFYSSALLPLLQHLHHWNRQSLHQCFILYHLFDLFFFRMPNFLNFIMVKVHNLIRSPLFSDLFFHSIDQKISCCLCPVYPQQRSKRPLSLLF